MVNKTRLSPHKALAALLKDLEWLHKTNQRDLYLEQAIKEDSAEPPQASEDLDRHQVAHSLEISSSSKLQDSVAALALALELRLRQILVVVLSHKAA